MIQLDLKLEGVTGVLRSLKRAETDWKRALAAALYQMALRVIAFAVPITPVKTGRLRGTAYAAPPKTIEDPESEAGYGTDYAVYVHERENARHKVGEAGFLRKAVNRIRNNYTRSLAALTEANYRRHRGPGSVSSSTPTQPKAGGRQRDSRGRFV